MKKPSYMLKTILVMIAAGLYGGGVFYIGLVLGEKRAECELIIYDGRIGDVVNPAAILEIYSEGCVGLNRTTDCKLIYPNRELNVIRGEDIVDLYKAGGEGNQDGTYRSK